MNKELRNSQILDTQTHTINCEDEQKEIIIANLKLENSYFTNQVSTYYLSQTYILQDNKWYIVSFASQNENIKDIAQDSISSIQCY